MVLNMELQEKARVSSSQPTYQLKCDWRTFNTNSKRQSLRTNLVFISCIRLPCPWHSPGSFILRRCNIFKLAQLLTIDDDDDDDDDDNDGDELARPH